jgi:hypothetical protein
MDISMDSINGQYTWKLIWRQKDHKHVQFTITKINDNIKHGQYNSRVNEY